MNISSVSYNSPNRAVATSRNGSELHANDETRTTEQHGSLQVAESRAQQRAQQQEKVQQQRQENQRRLDGRLYSLGQPGGEVERHQEEANRANYNRERVREAYSAPKNELTYSHSTNRQLHEKPRQHHNDPIDLVV